MSWLNTVPVCRDAYTWQATLVCEDCGKLKIAQLRKKGVADDGDSDTFPQGPYGDGGGEADDTQFCGFHRDCVNAVSVAGHKVGCPLGNPLTRYGVESLVKSVTEDMFERKRFSNLIGRLLRRVWAENTLTGYFRPIQCKPKYVDNLPDSLLHACKVHHASHTRGEFDGRIFADLDHAYLFYKHGDVVDLCRSEVDDDGQFGPLAVASIPSEVVKGRAPGDLIADAVEEGAWD